MLSLSGSVPRLILMDRGIPNVDRADSKDIPVFKVLPITRSSFFFLLFFFEGLEAVTSFAVFTGNAPSVGIETLRTLAPPVKVGLFNAGSDGAAVKPISASTSSFLSQAGRKITVAHNRMIDGFNDLKRLFLISIQPRTLRNKLPTDLIFAISTTTSKSKQLNNWMINHTPKPIVFKYFLWYSLVRVRKE